MKKRKLSVLTALALSAVLLLSACGSSSSDTEDTSSDDAQAEDTAAEESAEETETLSVTLSATASGVGFYEAIAEAYDLASQFNLDVTWESGLSSGPENIAAITGGSVDVALLGDFPVVTTQGNEGADFIVISAYTTVDSALFAKADSGIEEVADLAGKTVGAQAGTGSQFLLESALAEAGLTTDDVEVVYLDTGSWQSAFINDDIDAMAILEFYTIDNEEIGEVTTLARSDDALKSIIASTTWLEENPEAAARTLLLMDAVWGVIESDPEGALQAVLDNYDVSEAQAQYLFDSNENTILTSLDEKVSRYEAIKEFALENETIETDFDVADIYTNTYIELANELAAE